MGGRLIGLREADGSVAIQFDRGLAVTAAGRALEQATSTPAIAGGVVFFSTTTNRSTPCGRAETRLYALALDGGVAYDTNGDRRRDGTDGPTVGQARAGRATAPVVAGRHVFVGSGATVQVFGDQEGFDDRSGFPGIRFLSWREVR